MKTMLAMGAVALLMVGGAFYEANRRAGLAEERAQREAMEHHAFDQRQARERRVAGQAAVAAEAQRRDAYAAETARIVAQADHEAPLRAARARIDLTEKQAAAQREIAEERARTERLRAALE
jgi:hypothetical protein